MELAIPILAIGGMFIVSNSQNNKKKEGFNAQGYPVSNVSANHKQHDNPVSYDTQSQPLYQNYGNDLGFNQPASASASLPDEYFTSLLGEKIPMSDLTINDRSNRYLGISIKDQQYQSDDAIERVLNSRMSGDKYATRKKEQAPLFNQSKSISYPNGMPNTSNYLQSRVYSSFNQGGTALIQPEQVAPALGHGYNSTGVGGFNSGLLAREYTMPKSVDELRTEANPKDSYSYEGLEGIVQNKTGKGRTNMGHMEKNRPEQTFDVGQERWFTTTGVTQGKAMNGQYMPKPSEGMRDTMDTLEGYEGAAGTSILQANYVPSMHEESHKIIHTYENVLPISSAPTQRGPFQEGVKDGYTNVKTYRSENKDGNTFATMFKATMGAIVAPLVGIMKTTKKEDLECASVQHNLVPNNTRSYIRNPNDRLKTTMKETTLHSQHGFIQRQTDHNGAYMSGNVNRVNTQTIRDETMVSGMGNAGYVGGASSTGYLGQNVEATRDTPMTVDRRPNGGTNMFNNMHGGVNLRQDSNRLIGYTTPPSMTSKQIPNKTMINNYSVKNATYNENIQMERMMPNEIIQQFRDNPYSNIPYSTRIGK